MITAYDIPFTRNSIEHRVLAALCADNLSTAQLVKALGQRKTAAVMRMVVSELQKRNYVRSIGFDQWSITNVGVDV